MSDSLRPTDYTVHGILQAMEWVGHSLLQEIFPTQGLNPGLPHCRRILNQLSYQEKPSVPKVLYIFHLTLHNIMRKYWVAQKVCLDIRKTQASFLVNPILLIVIFIDKKI